MAMLPDNYGKHFKLLGKIARIYDLSASGSTTLKAAVDMMVEQFAGSGATGWDPLKLACNSVDSFNLAFTVGSNAVEDACVALGRAYLLSDDFQDDLTTSPADATSVAAVLTALQTDMGAGVDNKTLGTLATTGLVNFLNALGTGTGTWNTEADATADYRDAVYVVDTEVA